MTDQKNTILAIVLSAIVLIGWQYFFGLPQMEKQKQEAQQQQQQQQPQTPARRRRSRAGTAAGAQPARSRSARPGAGADRRPAAVTREAVLAASPRVRDRDAAAARLDRAQGRPRSTISR